VAGSPPCPRRECALDYAHSGMCRAGNGRELAALIHPAPRRWPRADTEPDAIPEAIDADAPTAVYRRR
jgi:hypothetical protein